MLHRIKSNVVNLIEIKGIDQFPLPIHTIQGMICSNGYQIIDMPGIKNSCIVGKYLICTAYKSKAECRMALAHELGHITLHDYPDGETCKLDKNQEWEADVFAMYCIMPPGIFENDLHTHTYFQLSEKYGVAVEHVKLRAETAEQKVS